MSKIIDGVLKPVAKGRGGVNVLHHKNTANTPIERMPAPATVVLPMVQHIGAPCAPTVKVGDLVKVGQVIGDSEAYVSAPIHASVSGKVTKIGDVTLANGRVCKAVTIESDGLMEQFEGLEPPVIESKADLVKAIRASGLVGLGGAGFPTHVKLNFPDDGKVDTLVINAAECEPYITVDFHVCVDDPQDVFEGVYGITKWCGFKNVIIAIEDNKPEAFKVLKEIADHDNDDGDIVKLMQLKSKYPQGAEKMMVYSATGRKVPPGKLPADVGCVVMNIASVAFVGRYLRTGKPLVSRSITVDGSAIKQGRNIRLPIGTSVREVIEYCGGFCSEPGKVMFGGPMMGWALYDIDVPVCKQNNAVLAFDRKNLFKKERDCIRCGRCVSVCPMHLMPTLIESAVKTKDVDKLNFCSVMSCMECGSCAYTCPSSRPLVQYMRLGKQLVKEGSAK